MHSGSRCWAPLVVLWWCAVCGFLQFVMCACQITFYCVSCFSPPLYAAQDLCASSEPDDPLPDPSCLHLSINTAALADIRAKKQLLLPQTQQQQTTKDSNIATARAGASATAGLWCCAAEWVGLSCRHSGTWQLSLVYDTAELDKFGQVRGASTSAGIRATCGCASCYATE